MIAPVLALITILFALVSIGDGHIAPSHWAFRCDLVNTIGPNRVVPMTMNLDGSITVYVLADTDCK